MNFVPAAQYLRMSTENQAYSLENQTTAIREYAETHGFKIVKSYNDAAKSGVQITSRYGLQQLLADVVGGQHDFKAVLVFDVSRWGRFQDTDESAHYEFICKSTGVRVHYCAEPFENDGSLANSLLKSLKRSMAAEFSKELGVKVVEGKRRKVLSGFYVGGRTPYGLSRQIVQNGIRPTRILREGEHKNIRGECIVLVPGRNEEVQCVRRIFSMVVRNRKMPREIAWRLNKEGCKIRGKRWTKAQVENIIQNPVYYGCLVWGRTSQRLGTPRIKRTQHEWAVANRALFPIVSNSVFKRAQKLLESDPGRTYWTPARILKSAKWLLGEMGELSYRIFDDCEDAPSSSTLRELDFESLCRKAGFELPKRVIAQSKGLRLVRKLRKDVAVQIRSHFPDRVFFPPGIGTCFLIDKSTLVSLRICRFTRLVKGERRWNLPPVASEKSNVTLLALMNPSNTVVEQFVAIPSAVVPGVCRIGPRSVCITRGTRFGKISDLCEIVQKLEPREGQPNPGC